MEGTPEVGAVDRTSRVADPVVRNLQITQTYAALSRAMAGVIPDGANWCTFATWASKQAGQTIRQEDLVQTFEDRLLRSPVGAAIGEALREIERDLALLRRGERPELPALIRALDLHGPFDRASDAVARGNLKVFAEIGREFARFLALPSLAAGAPESEVKGFVDGLEPGDPPEGQRHLRRAFAQLARAAGEPDAKVRAELVLLANVHIGVHEQTRLQPEIREALDAPIVDPRALKLRLLEAVAPPGSRGHAVVARLRDHVTPLDRVCRELAEVMRALVRQVVTDFLMTLHLPDGRVLRLGRDLGRTFPPNLRQIENRELRELLDAVDPTPGTTEGTGTEDWSDFGQRMHYIADLFRACQEDPQLFAPPFTAEQVLVLRAGRRPDGRL